MRGALLITMGMLVSLLACRTTQPPGTEDAMPIESPGQTDIQNVPAEPPGPAAPLTAPDAGMPGEEGLEDEETP